MTAQSYESEQSDDQISPQQHQVHKSHDACVHPIYFLKGLFDIAYMGQGLGLRLTLPRKFCSLQQQSKFSNMDVI